MKNKRSLFIVVAMVLLLAVVIGMGGTTFAKYITESDDVTNAARVAKWGYTFSATTDLFGKEYTKGTNYAEVVADNGVAVVSEDLVVAPGTAGEMTFTINPNGSEVLTQITFDVADGYTEVVLAKDDGGLTDGYRPVVWSLDDVVVGTLADLEEALEDLTYTIDAGTATPTNVKISWTWAYHVDADTDIMDTKLGSMANVGNAGTKGSSYSMSFTFTATATQIQVAPTP